MSFSASVSGAVVSDAVVVTAVVSAVVSSASLSSPQAVIPMHIPSAMAEVKILFEYIFIVFSFGTVFPFDVVEIISG